MCRCPADSLGEIGQLTLDKRFAAGDVEGPISDRNPDVVQSTEGSVVVRSNSTQTDDTHPAAAMAVKSASVIHEFQWLVSAACAVALFCNCPNVHSSTMAEFPVFSNSEGVIQG